MFLKRVLIIKDHEVSQTLSAFGVFFCILFSYFTVLPLRDEAAVLLGTRSLPKLFLSSLIATLMAAPAASTFLARTGVKRDVALRQLYLILASVMAMFFVSFEYQEYIKVLRAIKDGMLSDPLVRPGPATFSSHEGDPTLPAAARWFKACFYTLVNLTNMIAISAAWSRCADVFCVDTASRVFGFISAGATLGQLVGSLVAVTVANCLKSPSSSSSRHLNLLILLSSLSLVVAAVLSRSVQKAQQGPVREELHQDHLEPKHDRDKSLTGLQAIRRSVRTLGEGYRLVVSSSFLTTLCVYLMVTYLVGSLLYFERQLVVAASVDSPSHRATFFAVINSYSAGVIFVLQIFATGGLIRILGMVSVLLIGPSISFGSFVFIACLQNTWVVAASEVIRKVAGYSLIRPAREVLFTLVSREEKYKAKMVMDTVIQRLGDALAALVFQVMDVMGATGPPALAVVGCIACWLWVWSSLSLGRIYQALAQHTTRV